MWIKSLDGGPVSVRRCGNPINLALATSIYVRRSSVLESLSAEANQRTADVHLVVEFATMASVPNAVESPIVRSLSVVYSGSSEACFALRDQLAELVGAVTLEPPNEAVQP